MPASQNKERKKYSDYVVSVARSKSVNQCSKIVSVVNDSPIEIDPVGQPIVWNGTNFSFYDSNSDISSLTSEPEKLGGALVGVIIGNEQGEGCNQENIVINSAGAAVTALFRDAELLVNNIDWAVMDSQDVASVTPATPTLQAEFINQLEKQRIFSAEKAEETQPSYV